MKSSNSKSSRNSSCKVDQSAVKSKSSSKLSIKQTETAREVCERLEHSAKTSASSTLRGTNTSIQPEAAREEKPAHRGASAGKEKQLVADWVVKYLMPHYKLGAIQNKAVFKALARHLSHKVVLHAQAKGKRKREREW